MHIYNKPKKVRTIEEMVKDRNENLKEILDYYMEHYGEGLITSIRWHGDKNKPLIIVNDTHALTHIWVNNFKMVFTDKAEHGENVHTQKINKHFDKYDWGLFEQHLYAVPATPIYRIRHINRYNLMISETRIVQKDVKYNMYVESDVDIPTLGYCDSEEEVYLSEYKYVTCRDASSKYGIFSTVYPKIYKERSHAEDAITRLHDLGGYMYFDEGTNKSYSSLEVVSADEKLDITKMI